MQCNAVGVYCKLLLKILQHFFCNITRGRTVLIDWKIINFLVNYTISTATTDTAFLPDSATQGSLLKGARVVVFCPSNSK